MTNVRCFECERELIMGTTMEGLLLNGLPVFCSVNCSRKFPIYGTKEFKERMKALKEEFGMKQ